MVLLTYIDVGERDVRGGGHLPSKFKEVAIVGQAMVIRLMFLYYCYKHDLKPVFPVAVPLQRI